MGRRRTRLSKVLNEQENLRKDLVKGMFSWLWASQQKQQAHAAKNLYKDMYVYTCNLFL